MISSGMLTFHIESTCREGQLKTSNLIPSTVNRLQKEMFSWSGEKGETHTSHTEFEKEKEGSAHSLQITAACDELFDTFIANLGAADIEIFDTTAAKSNRAHGGVCYALGAGHSTPPGKLSRGSAYYENGSVDHGKYRLRFKVLNWWLCMASC